MAMFIASIFAVSAWAQTDVTSQYLKNAGFDDEASFVTNGICTYAKDCSVNGTTLSGMQPVNEWTFGVANGDALASGAYAWGSPHFLGGSGYTIPATDESGNSTGGALGICAVWDAQLYYYQDVTLPSGVYEFTYSVYNSGAGANTVNANFFGFLADNGASFCGTKKTFPANSWTTETVSFVLTAETKGKISVGIDAANAGSGSSHHLFVDYVKLTYNGEFGEVSPENPLDVTGMVGTSKDAWHATGGPVDIEGISMPEVFGWDASPVGDVMWQEVTGLENGVYTLELWANARLAHIDAVTEDGQMDCTYLFANNVELSIPVIHNKELNNNTSHVLEDVLVTDGTLKMGMTKKAAGSNWHTIQIKSLLYLGEASTDKVLEAKKAEFSEMVEPFVEVAYSIGELDQFFEACVMPVMMEVDEMNAALDEVTDVELLQEKINLMVEVEALIAEMQALYAEYKGYVKLFKEASEKTEPKTEEAAELLQYNMYGAAGMQAASVEALEQAVENIKVEYCVYAANANAFDDFMFDMTFKIVNPNFEKNVEGWECVKAQHNGGAGYNDVGGIAEIAEWGATSWDASMSQELTGLPNGTYVLKASWMAATGIEMVFAANDASVTITGIGAEGGNIAKDGSVVEMGQGYRGWQYVEVECEVIDGTLTILVSSSAQAQHMWSNADAFELYYVGGGDPEYTNIENINAEVETVIYDLSGRRVEKAVKGIYIVNGKKVVVK